MPADTAIVNPEHDDRLFPPIVLPAFPKGWAKGSCETLLESCQVTFSYRHAESVTSAKEFADTVTNRYLKAYYWDDPEDQEPTGPPPLPHKEVLTPQRKALKAVKLVHLTNAIYNWLNYRWKYPKIGPSPANSCNQKSEDPLHLLLCSVSGVDIGRSCALTAVERWLKDHFEEVKRDLEGETMAEGRAHVKKRYETLAKEEGKQVREVKQHAIENARALLSPTEAQLALNRLPATLAPFLKKLGSMLGVHACLFLAGPEPQKGGQINVLLMHTGFDKSPIHLKFPEAMPVQYEKSLGFFRQFIESCYSDEEMAARSLPPDELVQYMAVDAAILEDEVMPGAVETPSSKWQRDSDDNGTEKEDEHSCPKKKAKKAKKKHQKVSEEAEELAAKTGTGKKKKKATKKVVVDEVVADAPDAATMVVDDMPIHHRTPLHDATNHSVVPPGMENIDPSLFKEFITAMPRPCPCPRPQQLPAAPLPPPLHESFGDLPPITSPNDNPNPFAVSAEHPDAIIFCSSPPPVDEVVPPSHPIDAPSSHEDLTNGNPQIGDNLPLPPSIEDSADSSSLDASLLQEEKWKPWYKQIQKMVDSLELPGQWNLVTMYLTLLEGRNDFQKGNNSKADILLPMERPQWLSHWICCGRKALPHHELKDLTMMLEEWWKFWKSLQPEWRNIDGVKGPLGPSHCKEIVRGKEWGELAKCGVNGIVTVVVGLAFWGYAAKGGTWHHKDIWENAVEDMKWVLQCMSSK